MGYVIAVDVGTSRTAAAVARARSDGEISTAPFALGRHADSVPSSAFALSGELLWGDAAERRGLTQPDRLIREFTRRVGDDVPIIAGDQSFTAEQLFARMVAWVVDTVREREGHSPDAVAVTMPVTWGGYRTALIEGALARAGLGDAVIISEPEAAARRYEMLNPLEPGHALAVYDLGGGTFDAVILRKEPDGSLQPAGEPHGIRDLGGADFDDAVLRHAIGVAGLSTATLAADRGARMGVAALRRECVEAKEALSFDSDASIPVLLGDRETTVRLTRDEFEAMIEDAIGRTAETLAAALESADVAPDRIDAILLTGGSSRIPRVAQHLSARFDLPIATDVDPKAIIALGAASAVAAARAEVAAARLAARSGDVDADTDAAGAGAMAIDPAADVDAAAASGVAPHPARPSRSWFRRMGAGTLSGTGVVALAATMITLSASALGGAPIDHALGGATADAERASLTLPWTWDAAPAAALPTSGPAAAPLSPLPPTADHAPSARRAPGRATPSRPATPAAPTARTAPVAGSSGSPTAPGRPAPAPQPVAAVEPQPSAPATSPEPQPAPAPEPQVDPAPVTEPDPVPTSDPAPQPEPEPAPPTDPEPAPADPAPEQSEPQSDSRDHSHHHGDRGRDDRGSRSEPHSSESTA